MWVADRRENFPGLGIERITVPEPAALLGRHISCQLEGPQPPAGVGIKGHQPSGDGREPMAMPINTLPCQAIRAETNVFIDARVRCRHTPQLLAGLGVERDQLAIGRAAEDLAVEIGGPRLL